MCFSSQSVTLIILTSVTLQNNLTNFNHPESSKTENNASRPDRRAEVSLQDVSEVVQHTLFPDHQSSLVRDRIRHDSTHPKSPPQSNYDLDNLNHPNQPNHPWNTFLYLTQVDARAEPPVSLEVFSTRKHPKAFHYDLFTVTTTINCKDCNDADPINS